MKCRLEDPVSGSRQTQMYHPVQNSGWNLERTEGALITPLPVLH